MNIHRYILWFYTPMALPLSDDMSADLIIYDCMDETVNFEFAPEDICSWKSHLFQNPILSSPG